MQELIKLVNELQDVCDKASYKLPLDLPRIIVIGTQSSGKSSVIESIVRREFLPRGDGIVTRRPLVIRLIKQDDCKLEYVKFGHSRRIWTDFNQVRKEIQNETNRVCGQNDGVSHFPITLSVYSKDVVNLTLVDLPGFTKLPVGDQPANIEEQIETLVHEYIENPNSIILAVTPANTDFQTSEALKMALKVDPEGKRTLAVLTKLDTVEAERKLEVLEGKLIKVKLGIIGVVNRTQKQIIQNKPISKALEDEKSFFKNHYPGIHHKHGQEYLAKRLSQLLVDHIKTCLPKIREKINSLLDECQKELKSIGELDTDQHGTIIQMIKNFSLSYCSGETQKNEDKLVGGAKIRSIFHNEFGKELSLIKPLQDKDDRELLTAAKNGAGIETDIMVPEVFKRLVNDELVKMRGPCLECVRKVHIQMGDSRNCNEHVKRELRRFPKVGERIEEILRELLRERLQITLDQAAYMLDLETSYIDLQQPHLQREYKLVPLKLPDDDGREKEERSEREKTQCRILRLKIQDYFNIVRDRIKVSLPQVIMFNLYQHVKGNLDIALTRQLHKPELFDEILSESEDIANNRAELTSKIESLREARAKLSVLD